jgi:hypothetical protein
MNNIPRTIHKVWLGGGHPRYSFLQSWKEILPDWEIVEWSEQELLQEFRHDSLIHELLKSYTPTYASDYARILVLEKFGGVYADYDVELLRPIDKFLKHSAFVSYHYYPSVDRPPHLQRGLKMVDLIQQGKAFSYKSYGECLNNHMIGSAQNSTFISTYKEEFLKNISNNIESQFSFVDYGCGPSLLTHTVDQIIPMDLNGETCEHNDFAVYHKNFFHPTCYLDDPEAVTYGEFNFENQRKKAIELGSYAIHYQVSEALKKRTRHA